MSFSPDAVTVAWLMAPGTLQPSEQGQPWRCAGCNATVRGREPWTVRYRTDEQPEDGPRRDLMCLDCATRLAGVATRTADEAS